MKTKMEKTVTTWAMLIAFLTAVGCSESETAIDPEPGGNGDQVALGVAANLKVDAGARSVSKSVVSGEAITYTDYATAPGIGVVITNSSINGWYTPDDTGDKHHVWYMGDEAGANWISITTKGDTYGETKEVPYYLTKEIGKVYAYYPFAVDAVNGLVGISNESSLKIPVTVPTTGEAIDAATNNAKKQWNGAHAWVTNTGKLANLSSSTEKDYLYFAGEKGRNVNNGRADGQPLVSPGNGDNNSTTNPGYEINLDMKHAMAMVSFRVYDGGNLSDSDVNFTKFEIKNHADGSNPFKTGDGKMALKDGAITETSATTAMSRTINGYVLMRQLKEGETEGEHAFIPTGTGTNDTNGKTVSKIVSTIVYPIASFADNQIDVVISLQKGADPAVEYTVTLPGISWTAGQNYIYTFSASRTKLTVVDVSVTPWEDKEQPEIPL